MGCWNETCAVTGSPICINDEVVLVLFDSNSQSFINDIPHYYVPYLKNISKGTYNGYGWIKENEKLKDIMLNNGVDEQTVETIITQFKSNSILVTMYGCAASSMFIGTFHNAPLTLTVAYLTATFTIVPSTILLLLVLRYLTLLPTFRVRLTSPAS